MPPRSLFIHAGIHKTGTTSLQVALAQNPAWLAAHGYRYPVAGLIWNPGGHHNIAWEIANDRRLQRKYGTAQDLITEVRDGDYNVILSSEDFTAGLQGADRFQEFLRPFKEIFSDICVVVFLRNQADYAASLYSELLCHGYNRTFESFLDEITTTGVLRWREWCFQFDFEKFLSTTRRIDGIRLKICSYDLSKDGDLLSAFATAAEFPELAEAISLTRENTRRSVGRCLAQFLRNRAVEPLDTAQTLILNQIEDTWNSKVATLSMEHRRLLQRVFRNSNSAVSAQYGVPLNDFMHVSSCTCKSRQFSSSLAFNCFSLDTEQRFTDLSTRLKSELQNVNAVQVDLKSDQTQIASLIETANAILSREMSPLRAVERVTLGEQVAVQLAAMIDEGPWRDGETLPAESELCTALNVGRSTLHEALKSLAFIGLERMSAGDGTYVAEPTRGLLDRLLVKGLLKTEKDLAEVCETRMILETELAGLAAERATRKEIALLKELLAKGEAALTADRKTFSEIDLQFHLAVANCSQNNLLPRLLLDIRGLLVEWIAKSQELPGLMENAHQQHGRIVESIARCDAHAARKEMQEHLETFQRAYKLLGRIGKVDATKDGGMTALVGRSGF